MTNSAATDGAPVDPGPHVQGWAHGERVLIADDDATSRRLLRQVLESWGYVVAVAEDGKSAWEMLCADDPPRIAVLDWEMPEMSGVQVTEELRGQRDDPYIYVILLTGRKGKQALLEGMEAGADDFVTKRADHAELEVRLRAGQRIVDLQRELRRQATHDSLTGLWNRATILGMLDNELRRGRRLDEPIAAVIADIDHFKRINDTLGHQAGDEVLAEAARRMGGVLRDYDALGRYGGEEFLIVMSQVEPPGAEQIAERVRRALEADPVICAAGSVPITASFGVATAREASVESERLIAAADVALYRAKELGRNRVEVATVAECDVVSAAR